MTEVIRLDNVSKKFIIHHQKHRSFQDIVVNVFRDTGSREEFWALKDMSFSVRKGETIGLIGQNGSGKSTALKLITRIIEPTAGKVTINGTVSSLLELGAGFHPELTGRENVFLNGSLLGFSRRKMENLFDEIVDFAELSQFIDTPVKHYSSGMYMRLAFAVAINVDPEILLIDEVLAVGDLAFQEKCFDRIRDFQRRGKTIVLVTHALEMVKNLCNRAIWLDHGKMRSVGESKKVVFEYLREVEGIEDASEGEMLEQAGEQSSPVAGGETSAKDIITINHLKILDGNRVETHRVRTGDDVVVELGYVVQSPESLGDCMFAVSVSDASGTLIHRALCALKAHQLVDARRAVLQLKYTKLPLLEGMYSITAATWPTDAPDSPFDAYQHKYRVFVEATETAVAGLEDGIVSLHHQWLIRAASSDFLLESDIDLVAKADGVTAMYPSTNGHNDVSKESTSPPFITGEELD